MPVKVKPFALHEVRLLDGPFKQAEELDTRYLLELEPDRLLAPYVREAGLPVVAGSYGNWENTGLDGHIGGHYLSALSLMYASTGDVRIKERLDYMLAQLRRCQEAAGDGYLGGVPGGKAMWKDIAAGKIAAGSFELNKKWVPLYNIHKIYAGLRDAWTMTGNGEAREMLVKLSDWALRLVSGLSDKQIQQMLRSEHGGLNEVFADVAAITGEYKYLLLARRFSHQVILQPLLAKKDQLTGLHANTQIPKVIGYERIAQVAGDTSWHQAARFFWETVVRHRSVSIGGNSVREHFHSGSDFSSMMKDIQGPESCNTYNMLRLTKMLYEDSGEAGYVDYYERALYNHIYSTQHPRQGGLVYFTPMRAGHYRVYSQPHTSFWCCVGSGLESHAKYGEMIYARDSGGLYVNMFIPSKLYWKEKDVEVVQRTAFPDEEFTELTIDPCQKTEFSLNLRCPGWVRPGGAAVWVNGKRQAVAAAPGEYITVTRRWKKGDRVKLRLPMHLAAECLPDSSGYYSFLYGPVVLAARTGQAEMPGTFADDSRGGHIASGPGVPLQEMPVIIGEPEQVLSQIAPAGEGKLSFRLTCSTLRQDTTLMLEPFSRLHEARYMAYWQVLPPGVARARREQLEREEQEAARLKAITVDEVGCGEQQPESDHFILSEGSRAGTSGDDHWREASQWFSYELRNPVGKAVRVQLVCRGKESAGRRFTLWVDGEQLAGGEVEAGVRDEWIVFAWPLPEPVRQAGKLTVRIAAGDGTTPRVAVVRLLSE